MLDQKQILSRLTQRKLEIEAAISAQHEILNANSIGMDEPLVDNEGYPRSDIDVYKDIEKSLHDYHAQMSRNGAENGGPATVTQQQNVARGGSAAAPLPFAVVGKVENGSPADIAGLSAGDKIVKFGSVNAGNFKDVTDIAAVVQHSVGRPVNVLVKRDANAVSVVLTPKQWHGKGLLGCTVLPMS
ncbi:hypothetical protein HPB49_010481 [Dermacentor silvarum]|uniref:Uncharacterized protein n=1 Tax=Dermacentor silvarum TaxID=543639 RepID=A0ACB8C8Y5_DERSI|nr:hypothetical protein HPB49_010481 [Dermacentor silvarum]